MEFISRLVLKFFLKFLTAYVELRSSYHHHPIIQILAVPLNSIIYYERITSSHHEFLDVIIL